MIITKIKNVNYKRRSDMRLNTVSNRLEGSSKDSSKGNNYFIIEREQSKEDHEERYLALESKAFYVALSIINSTIKPCGGSPLFVYNACKQIVEKIKPTHKDNFSQYDSDTAFYSLDLLLNNWDEFANNKISGEDIVRKKSGLWSSLMNDWPLKNYAEMTAEFLIKNNLLSGRVLEIGSGVGATSKLLKNHVNSEYIRTDLYPKIITRLEMPGVIEKYDFNHKGKWNDLDVIFGVNALHCSRDIIKSLKFLRKMLSPSGILVLGEGSPYTNNFDTPWALSALFGIFDGWWNIGGFIHRYDWFHLLRSAGFSRIGYQMLCTSKHDLGGLIWAKN